MDENSKTREGVSDEHVRNSLQQILSSKSFAGAERLKAFLIYIVEETLAGRGQQIRAKRIAADVYNRNQLRSVEQNTLVRVDAGRLRRRLELYYASEGRIEPLQIIVRRGGYRPEFERMPVIEPAFVPVSTRWPPNRILVSVGVVCALMTAIAITLLTPIANGVVNSVDSVLQQTEVKRGATFEQSPATLQAHSLVEEARALTFPPLNPIRLKAAIELCGLAIERAPDYYGGYSCSARAISFLAFFSDAGPVRKKLTMKAGALARRAVEIDPTRSHAQSAKAWAMFVEGDFEAAIEEGRRAVFLNPDNLSAWNYAAMMAGFNGDGRDVIDNIGMPAVSKQLEEIYHPFILAGANFQISNYSETIRFVELAASKLGHSSPLILSILAVSYLETGNRKKAEGIVKTLVKIWPGKKIEYQLLKFYRHPETANKIISQIYEINPALKLANR